MFPDNIFDLIRHQEQQAIETIYRGTNNIDYRGHQAIETIIWRETSPDEKDGIKSKMCHETFKPPPSRLFRKSKLGYYKDANMFLYVYL